MSKLARRDNQKQPAQRQRITPDRAEQNSASLPAPVTAFIRQQAPDNGPLSPDNVLQLQRVVGNKAVRQLLNQGTSSPSVRTGHWQAARLVQSPQAAPIQRYITTNNYTFAGAAGATLFSSQDLRPRAAQPLVKELHRGKVNIDAGGGLESQDQSFQSPAAGWANVGGPAALANQPQIKVSQGGQLAIQATSQARLFFIDPALIAATNIALTAANSRIRLLPTGGPTLTVFPGTANQNVLTQVTVELAANPGAPAAFAVQECNDVAAQVTGNAINGALANQAHTPDLNASPLVGQAYGFRSGFEDSRRTTKELNKGIPQTQAAFQAKMDQIVQQIQPIYQHVGAGVAVNFANIGRKARAMLPGWGTHFEGVIARDGSDNITLANYNRVTEIKFEKRRIFLELYNAHAAFAGQFSQHIQGRLAANPGLTWRDITNEMISFTTNVVVNGLVPGLTQDITTMATNLNNQKEGMWYFEMYGPGNTFHAKYQEFSRGAGSSTRVIP